MTIADAWRTAGVELGIHVTAPARVQLGSAVGEFDAFVADFGSGAGTLVASSHRVLDSATREAAKRSGFFVSQVDPESYAVFDRSLFVDTLNDWGWFGTDERPDWYTGESW
ncbi:hypothetical protein ASE12_10250 [Aeromicrobium sp. Root236]|uniref:hypothetical protein n=1 Tax=Aeromicrobium sp. Root236 TaxID=1736498 RepID=UPI0006FCA31B|nr:hypothetical protein [Aeromicrobium sp. Root236]KRC65109.1 hypothetical protein ASE12_10250 [Aeromicrobium sp. Root236]